jgi:simple sugar transport system permease protein
MLLALGMTLVIATGGIDLSVGAVIAIAGATAASLLVRPDGSPLSFLNVHHSVAGVILITLGLALLAGLWNGVLVAWLDIQPIVATLILMVAGRGVAQLLTDGQIITFENPSFQFLGSGFLLGIPFTIFIVTVAYLLGGALTRGTALGLFIESVGNNAKASRYAGVSARRVKLMVYGLCGFCAGVAGLIVTADIKAADANNAGLYLELDAILAVAIGGTSLAGGRFSLIGSLIGALVIQTLTTTILTRGVAPELTLVVKAAVVIAVCLLQSEPFRAALARGLRRRPA